MGRPCSARLGFAFCCAALTLCCSSVARAATPSSPTLPLKRVRLYETGVGYFERTGRVEGSQGLSLPVPAGHLDDALKTLVVLSPDGQSTVRGFEFRSSASRPLALALAGLSPDADGAMSYSTLLRSLKGASVEVRAGQATHRGRIVDVLAPAPNAADECAKASELAAPPGGRAGASAGADAFLAHCAESRSMTVLLLTESSEIRSFRSTQIDSVRPTDPAFQARLGTALDTLSQRGAQTRRDVQLQATAGKSVTLGYVAEAPLWRTTYRIVLDQSADRAVMQGWALLHNDTDEDWHSVHVELVNGRPDSFLFPLAAPRYARRELVTPNEQLSTVPQLLDTTVDNMWGDEVGESFGAGGLGLSGIGEGGGGRGEGIGLGSIGTIGHGAGLGATLGSSDVLSVGNLAPVQEAEGVEAGALFRYELASPVDLRAHGSALLPFVQRPVHARRIALFSAPGESAHSAVHIDNDTGQTLPAGPLSVFADGGFAGESALSRTKPAESRIIRYGLDLDVELTEQNDEVRDTPKLLVFQGNDLVEHFIRHHHVSYDLVNRSASGRTVYLKLSYVRNSEVTGTEPIVFDPETSSAHVVFEVAGKARVAPAIDVREGLERTLARQTLTAARLKQLSEVDSLPPEQRDILRQASARLRAADTTRAQVRPVREDLIQAQNALERLRMDLQALAGQDVSGAGDLMDRVLAAEDRVQELENKLRHLETEDERHCGAAKAELRKLRR
jgi:hypothetical protein